MALTWEALATRDARLLSQALERRHALPAGTAWVNYVRSHDDIGWTFADEDAAELGIAGFPHRRFLNDFFVNRISGSFARGVPFQENVKTGDARVAGTTASLAGIEALDDGGEDRVVLAHAIAMSTGGIPLLYLGDEVAQLNDYSYAEIPELAGDSRWANRPQRPRAAYDDRRDPDTTAGRVYRRLTELIRIRKATPEFRGNALVSFHTPQPSLLAYLRPGLDDTQVLVVANVGDHPARLEQLTLSGLEPTARDLLDDRDVDLSDGLELGAHAFRWLRVRLRHDVTP
jgi:amylosucrase